MILNSEANTTYILCALIAQQLHEYLTVRLGKKQFRKKCIQNHMAICLTGNTVQKDRLLSNTFQIMSKKKTQIYFLDTYRSKSWYCSYSLITLRAHSTHYTIKHSQCCRMCFTSCLCQFFAFCLHHWRFLEYKEQYYFKGQVHHSLCLPRSEGYD